MQLHQQLPPGEQVTDLHLLSTPAPSSEFPLLAVAGAVLEFHIWVQMFSVPSCEPLIAALIPRRLKHPNRAEGLKGAHHFRPPHSNHGPNVFLPKAPKAVMKAPLPPLCDTKNPTCPQQEQVSPRTPRQHPLLAMPVGNPSACLPQPPAAQSCLWLPSRTGGAQLSLAGAAQRWSLPAC